MWVLIFRFFSIYSENQGVQAVPFNFSRSSDIPYVSEYYMPRLVTFCETEIYISFDKHFPHFERFEHKATIELQFSSPDKKILYSKTALP